MKQIEEILGNSRTDSELATALDSHREQGSLETVRIAAAERKRSRLRVETDAGTDLGVVPDRPLRAGDVLVLDEERAVVVAFERRKAAVIDLPEPTAGAVAAAVELGHRVGNQHWDLAVDEGAVYIPVEADRHIIENVLADSLPAGTTIRYEEVGADRWIDEEEPAAEHSHGSEHGHSHDSESEHSHDHGAGGHSHRTGGEQS